MTDIVYRSTSKTGEPDRYHESLACAGVGAVPIARSELADDHVACSNCT